MYELKVNGMTCGGCANSINRAVLKFDSNATLKIDVESKTVEVETKKSVEDISKVIEEAGFSVTSAKNISN